ncbi:porin family protein [Flavobacterium sp. WC2409]|jgi:hypothetical protein|uniref:Porin family protein n=2 Tax=unclassified Flavobacterium TaxID=196869 RepID=A0AB39W3K3_9FLAO
MKKIIFTIAVLFIITSNNAQDKKEMSFGIKAGLNIATVTHVDNSKALVGFEGGVFGEFMIGDKFAIQPEVLYSGQGVKSEGMELKLDYINIPILAKYYVADSFSIELGPQVGFLISAKSEGVDVKEFFKTTDISVDFGANYDITKNFIFGVRYDLGLLRLQESIGPGEKESKNSVIQIAVGYKF